VASADIDMKESVRMSIRGYVLHSMFLSIHGTFSYLQKAGRSDFIEEGEFASNTNSNASQVSRLRVLWNAIFMDAFNPMFITRGIVETLGYERAEVVAECEMYLLQLLDDIDYLRTKLEKQAQVALSADDHGKSRLLNLTFQNATTVLIEDIIAHIVHLALSSNVRLQLAGARAVLVLGKRNELTKRLLSKHKLDLAQSMLFVMQKLSWEIPDEVLSCVIAAYDHLLNIYSETVLEDAGVDRASASRPNYKKYSVKEVFHRNSAEQKRKKKILRESLSKYKSVIVDIAKGVEPSASAATEVKGGNCTTTAAAASPTDKKENTLAGTTVDNEGYSKMCAEVDSIRFNSAGKMLVEIVACELLSPFKYLRDVASSSLCFLAEVHGCEILHLMQLTRDPAFTSSCIWKESACKKFIGATRATPPSESGKKVESAASAETTNIALALRQMVLQCTPAELSAHDQIALMHFLWYGFSQRPPLLPINFEMLSIVKQVQCLQYDNISLVSAPASSKDPTSSPSASSASALSKDSKNGGGNVGETSSVTFAASSSMASKSHQLDATKGNSNATTSSLSAKPVTTNPILPKDVAKIKIESSSGGTSSGTGSSHSSSSNRSKSSSSPGVPSSQNSHCFELNEMCMDPHFYVKRQVAIIEVLDSFLEANEVQVETKGPSADVFSFEGGGIVRNGFISTFFKSLTSLGHGDGRITVPPQHRHFTRLKL